MRALETSSTHGKPRWRRSSGWAAGLLAVCLLAPAPARAQADPDFQTQAADYAAVAFDLAILRPLGFAAAAIGFAFFIPAAVITAPGGRETIEEAWEQMVVVPGRAVFRRPLGDF